jgi:hypothetical protein
MSESLSAFAASFIMVKLLPMMKEERVRMCVIFAPKLTFLKTKGIIIY